ncbi:MAG TPA: ABC transporter permease [Actinomycetota bacterium]|nr:ABC transporter permease [Actinomycetota bacterium]
MKALMAQARVELTLTIRRGESLLVTIFIPASLLIFFSLVPMIPAASGTDAVNALLPGVLATAIMASAMVSLGIATGFERQYLVLKRLGGTPLGRPRLIAAKMISVLAVQVIQTIALIAIAYLLGWTPGKGAWFVVPVIAVGTIAFAGIGLAMAGSLKAEANLALVNALFIVVLLIGGVLVPLDHLPQVLGATMRFLPASSLAELLRWPLMGGGFPSSAAAITAVWAVVTPTVASRTFRWE